MYNISISGKVKADRLQHISLTVFDKHACKETYKKRGASLSMDSQLCVGGEKGRDSCVGDSGSALMISTTTVTPEGQLNTSWKLVGIVSFGPQKCGSKNVPGVYAKVRHYIGWIKNEIEKLE